ncbi:exonuclease activity [Sparganum proliferum]
MEGTLAIFAGTRSHHYHPGSALKRNHRIFKQHYPPVGATVALHTLDAYRSGMDTEFKKQGKKEKQYTNWPRWAVLKKPLLVNSAIVLLYDGSPPSSPEDALFQQMFLQVSVPF